jgi:hypothetical protein
VITEQLRSIIVNPYLLLFVFHEKKALESFESVGLLWVVAYKFIIWKQDCFFCCNPILGLEILFCVTEVLRFLTCRYPTMLHHCLWVVCNLPFSSDRYRISHRSKVQ